MDRHNFDHLYKSQTLTPNQKNYLKISKAVEKHRLLNIVAVERDGRKFYYKDKPTKWFTPLLSARKFIEGIDVEAYKKSALKYDWVRYF
ncbi:MULTISPECIES: hypothetical protein [Olivibacter]|uniref:Uncharacterized protein n=1 Tax=Olivibacter jilunii TaxID=985016 RepID=A0ABW6AXC9_9SPHI